MSSVLIATLGGFVALIFWGVSNWLVSRSSKKNKPYEVNLALQTPGLFIMVAILFFSGKTLPDLATTLIIILVSVFFTIAYILFIKALSTGSLGVIAPLVEVNALITIILSVSFLSVVFKPLQIVSMVVILIGAVLIAYTKNPKKIPLRIFHKETLLALSAAIMWGIAYFIANTVVDKVPWQVMLGVISITQIVLAFGIIIFAYKSKAFTAAKKSWGSKSGLYAGAFFTLGAIGFYYGAEKSGSVLIPVVIVAAAPLVASLLGALIEKERIGFVKRAGALIVVAGVILLNIS